MRYPIMIGLLAALTVLAGSCDKVNNTEVPNYPVDIRFYNVGVWDTYGVSGVGDWKIYDRQRGIPAGFPYNANTFTGYGGVLLIVGLDSSTGDYRPLAYDAACPVENNREVIVTVDPRNFDAVCAKCGSHYNVLTGMGGPISGTAHTTKMGLRVYHFDESGRVSYRRVYSY